jgi:hypothetical protein
MVSDHVASLCGVASPASDRRMEGTEGSNHGYCRISGCPLYLFRREPPSPGIAYLWKLVGNRNSYSERHKYVDIPNMSLRTKRCTAWCSGRSEAISRDCHVVPPMAGLPQ